MGTAAFALTLLSTTLARADGHEDRPKPSRTHCVVPAIVGGILGAGAGTGIGYAIGGMEGESGTIGMFAGAPIGASLGPIPACAVASEDPRTVPAATFVIGGLYLGSYAGAGALYGIGRATGPIPFIESNWIVVGAAMWTFVGGGMALGAYGGWRLHQWRERTSLTVTPTANGFALGGRF